MEKKKYRLTEKKNFRTICRLNKIARFILFSLFIFHTAKSQTFTGAGGPIANNGVYTNFSLPVSGLPQSQIDSVFGLEQVCINLTHPVLSQLNVFLQSPSGTVVQLVLAANCNGTDFVGTCFSSQPGTSITLGTAPYTGVFKPIGYLGRFNTGQNGNGSWTLLVHDYLAFQDSGSVVSWNLTFGNSPCHPVQFTSSNLPIVVINTNGQAISETDVVADMGIIDNGASRNYLTDPFNNYNNKTTLHIRGSTSKNFEKKSYNLELRNGAGAEIKANILGMPKESDWDLIAPYLDKSLARVPITYDMYKRMGHYSSRIKNVELMLNGEYRGIYMMVEKPKRDSNRINIAKLSVNDNGMPDITGGYIIKIDRTGDPGWISLLPGNSGTTNFYYQYVYPKDSLITSWQKNYIKSVLDTFETVMNAANYADPVNGYAKYIDVNSFVDFFIMNELSKNVDAYRLSTYLYKKNIYDGNKLFIGPVWDYDLAWHNCNYGNSFNVIGWQYQIADIANPSPTWWSRFMQDSGFVDKLKCRWQSLRTSVLSDANLYAYVDSLSLALNESMQRNFTQWPLIGAGIFPNPQSQAGASYSGEVNDLKNWITGRANWLDNNIPGACIVGTGEELFTDMNIRSFPNPFFDSMNIVYKIEEPGRVRIELLNLAGVIVHLQFNGEKKPGDYTEQIALANLAAGVYVVRMSVNNKVYHQKLVKANY